MGDGGAAEAVPHPASEIWWWMRKWGDKKREPAEAAGLRAAEFLHSRDELQDAAAV
jgi:hypothetical protein